MNTEMTKGVARLLDEAGLEIESLRRRNEIYAAQDRVLAIFEAALLGRPSSGGFSLDVVHRMRETAEMLRKMSAPTEQETS